MTSSSPKVVRKQSAEEACMVCAAAAELASGLYSDTMKLGSAYAFNTGSGQKTTVQLR